VNRNDDTPAPLGQSCPACGASETERVFGSLRVLQPCRPCALRMDKRIAITATGARNLLNAIDHERKTHTT